MHWLLIFWKGHNQTLIFTVGLDNNCAYYDVTLSTCWETDYETVKP